MLEGIRIATKNWIGRTIMTIVMGVLIVSFAIWGIGDMVRGTTDTSVGSVGGTKITAEQVRQAYQNELARLQRQTRQPITNDQARQAGLDRLVTDRIVGEMAVDQKARGLGLAISDDAIRSAIVSDPTFQIGGRFDLTTYQAVLRESNLTENAFVQLQRDTYLRRELMQAVVGDITAPQSLLAAAARYRDETRVVEVADLPATAIGEVAAPTQEQLQSFFDQRRPNYRAPAYRKVALLTVSPASVAAPDQVAAADVAAFYEREKATRFTRPEKRRILQIVYQTEAEATAAAAKLATGGFDALLAEKNLKESDVDLGLKTQAEIFDKAIGAAAFAQAVNTASAPVKGDFGWTILKVAGVEAGEIKPLAEVEGEIREAIALQRTAEAVRTLRERIEDIRANGKSVIEVGKDLAIPVREIAAIDAAGRDDKGAPLAGLPVPERLVRAIFATDIGADNLPISTGDGGYVWYDVLNIAPARDRTLDEARAQIETDWRDDEIARRLRARADEILATVKDGVSFADAVKAAGVEARRVDGLTRNNPAGLAPTVAAQVFNYKVGENASAGTPAGRTLFRVISSAAPAYDAAKTPQQVTDQMGQSLQSEAFDQFIAQLKTQAKATVNRAAVNQALFGSNPNN